MKRRKKILLAIALLVVILLAGVSIVMVPALRFFYSEETFKVDSALTVIQGGGGNSGVLVTDSAVVVIDTKMGNAAGKLHTLAVEKARGKPIIVINTHYHGDHVNGNKWYAGSRIYIGGYDKGFLDKEIDKENMPTDFVKDTLTLTLGNETVRMINLGQAHTWDDMVVYLVNRKVLFTGDLVSGRINPFLNKRSGADAARWIAALDKVMMWPDIDLLVPGHGKMGGIELASCMRQYFADMTTAAVHPSEEKMMKEKYREWISMPMMATPGITIKYIRNR
jgi:glyoxylase-like metal-dependent hydrolase (beta-lactamase superfamily II)